MCTVLVCEDDMKEDTVQVIEDASEKFKLYMAHVCQCLCQSQALCDIESQLKKRIYGNKRFKNKINHDNGLQNEV